MAGSVRLDKTAVENVMHSGKSALRFFNCYDARGFKVHLKKEVLYCVILYMSNRTGISYIYHAETGRRQVLPPAGAETGKT